MSRSWIDDEPGWADAKQELRCVYARLRVRWKLALLITCVITVLGIGYRARKQRTFESTVVMRVTEVDLDMSTAPPTSNQLQQHLSEVALSRRVLLKLINDNKLYPSEYHIDPNLAIERFREDIELYVVSNYFARERYSEDPPRSARIAITYIGVDPEQTLAVVRQLGKQVETEQQGARQSVSLEAAHTAEQALDILRAQLLKARQREATLKLDLPRLEGSEQEESKLELIRLASQIEELQRNIKIHTERGTDFELRSQFEGEAMGLRFEVVDPGKQSRVILTNREVLAIFGISCFLFVFPVAAVGVGTFDSRVRDVNSLKRLGLEPFGHVPTFQGIDRGSFVARTKASPSPQPVNQS
ncbi:MAG: hypothetical protein R3B07_03680 [Polyangiaceae bacterium]